MNDLVMNKVSLKDCRTILQSKSIDVCARGHSIILCGVVVDTSAPKHRHSDPETKTMVPTGQSSDRAAAVKMFAGMTNSNKWIKNIPLATIIERMATEQECKIICQNPKNVWILDGTGATLNGVFFSRQRLMEAFPENMSLQHQVLMKYSRIPIYCDGKLIQIADFLLNMSNADCEKLMKWQGDLCACATNVHTQFALVIGNIGFYVGAVTDCLHLPWNSILRYGVWSCHSHVPSPEVVHSSYSSFWGNFWCFKSIAHDEHLNWNCVKIGEIRFDLIRKQHTLPHGISLLLKGFEDPENSDNSFLQIGTLCIKGKELQTFCAK